MNKVINIYKPIGMTPLELIDAWRASNQKYADVKIGYIGRLDPMAHGVMVLMIGDANFEIERYKGLGKTYQVKILLGVETDTFDILGLIADKTNRVSKRFERIEIEKSVKKYLGKITQQYPPFSSVKVKGKPLFWWARAHRLSEIEIPQKKVEIYSVDAHEIENIEGEKLLKLVEERVKLVRGDFRQTEILSKWRGFLTQGNMGEFQVVSIEVECGSGTYMRSISHNLGNDLGIGGIALEILRTKVGGYTLETSEYINTLKAQRRFE
jgi:tRNA pseudouridine55 synthase